VSDGGAASELALCQLAVLHLAPKRSGRDFEGAFWIDQRRSLFECVKTFDLHEIPIGYLRLERARAGITLLSGG